MKRIATFVLLFGAGLVLLLYFEDDRPRRVALASNANADPNAGPTASPTASPTGAFDAEVDEGADTAFAGTAALELRGPFQLLRYGEAEAGSRPTILHLEANDTEALADGEIRFRDVTAIWNDEGNGEPRVIIRSATASMRLTESGQRYPIDFEQDVAEDRLVLNDVGVVLHQGAPVTPLTLEIASLEGNFSDRLFTSNDEATARGPGLFARGTGLMLDLVHGVLRFDADSEVRFDDEESRSAALTSAGKLHVLRGFGGGAEVIARESARLSLMGDDPIEIAGDRINLIAAPSAGDGSVHLKRLSAHGAAVIESSTGRFVAERGDLQLSPTGEVRAELIGEPRATLTLQEDGDAREFEIEVSGVGPLAVNVAERRSFEFFGPAELAWEDNRLVSTGGLRGWEEADGFSISCWGDVVLTEPRARLETEALDLRVARLPSGDTSVLVTTNSTSRIEGLANGEHPYELTAEQILYRQEGSRWFVPLALGVELRVDSEPHHHLRADRIEDLDIATQRVVAEGDVFVERGTRRSTGRRFVGHGVEHFTLDGTPEVPARLTLPLIHVEGLRLERNGTYVAASGSAATQIVRADGVAELWSDSLHGNVVQEDLPDGGRSVSYDLQTDGSVSALFQRSGDSGSVECASLHVVQVERKDASGALVESRTLFEFDGGVTVETNGTAEKRTLQARTASFQQAELEGPWVGSARHEVFVSRTGDDESAFRGEGDELSIDADGHAHLSGLDGDVVRFSGLLPGGRYPFELEAPTAEVSADHVSAENARVWIRSLSLVPGPGAEADVESEVVAEADRLSAVATELVLSGAVQLSGVDDHGVDFVLDSEFLQFEAGKSVISTKPVFRRMHVWGGFELHYGDAFSATGDRMEARAATGRLYMTGSPARVAYGDWIQVADSLEYDLFLKIIVAASSGHVHSAQPGVAPDPR